MHIYSHVVKNIFQTVIGACFLFTAFAASASTITLSPNPAGAPAGSSFVVTVDGAGFTEGAGGTVGGGLLISWDPNIIELQPIAPLTAPYGGGLDTSLFNGDQFFALPPVLDNDVGTLEFSTTSFFGDPSATPSIAALTFNALLPGTFDALIDVSVFDVWADLDSNFITTPVSVGTTIVVSAIPVPAAVWLFGSGLLGLVGIARRKKA